MVAGARLHVDPKQNLASIGGFFRGTGGMTPHCWHHQAYRRKNVDRQPKLCRNYVSFGEPSLQAAFRPRKWKRNEKEMKRKWKGNERSKIEQNRSIAFPFQFFPICFYSSLWFWQVTGWRTAISFSIFCDPLLQHVCLVQDVLQRFESFFERYLAPKQRTCCHSDDSWLCILLIKVM